MLISPAHEEIPYKQGFKSGFTFLNDYDDDFLELKKFKRYRKEEKEKSEGYWLLNRKSKKSLNTQFEKENRVFIHPKNGFLEGESVFLSSNQGMIELVVELDEGVREDCVIVHPNTLHINKLTPPIESFEGKNACYGEVKVKIFRV